LKRIKNEALLRYATLKCERALKSLIQECNNLCHEGGSWT